MRQEGLSPNTKMTDINVINGITFSLMSLMSFITCVYVCTLFVLPTVLLLINRDGCLSFEWKKERLFIYPLEGSLFSLEVVLPGDSSGNLKQTFSCFISWFPFCGEKGDQRDTLPQGLQLWPRVLWNSYLLTLFSPKHYDCTWTCLLYSSWSLTDLI